MTGQKVATTVAINPLFRAGIILWALLSLNLMIPRIAQADQTGDSLVVNFHGTLKRKPCHISIISPIHFGNVGVHKVDGTRYTQPVPYTLTCDAPDPSAILKMTLRGAVTGYDKAAITTSFRGLGIRILLNGQPMEINNGLAITYTNLPSLQAVLVQQPGEPLLAGVFRATATLLAEYE